MKIIVITGPTATGKTDLAIKLSKKFDGKIINSDSRQVYKGMDIGTNKGRIKENGDNINLKDKIIKGFDLENSGVTGYLFDLFTPNIQFNLSKFQKITIEIIEKIISNNNLPFLTGGTGLYLDSIIKGYKLDDSEPDIKLRQELSALSVVELQNKLKQLNIEIYNNLNDSDKKNPRRLIRSIERLQLQFPLHPLNENLFETLIIYPKYDKETLYYTINNRVEDMFEQGFVNEVELLVKSGFSDTSAMNGMGYREIKSYLKGEVTIEQVKKIIKQVHRNYAKRQITWFEGGGRNYNLKVFDFQNEFEEISEEITSFLKY